MTDDPHDRRGLVLVGPRGVGKSSVGRIVAGRLGREFVDVDTHIEAFAGRRIAAIFAEGGELAFRNVERAAIGRLTHDRPGAVLAPGGGAVLDAANRKRLRRFGLVVWLTADPSALADRLLADVAGAASRPALTDAGMIAEVAAVMAAREPVYREVADAVVDTTGRDVEQVADAVLAAWPGPPGGA